MSEVCADLEVASVLSLFFLLEQLLATESNGASGLASAVSAPGLMILSAVPPFLPEVASLLVSLVLMGRLSPSDSPLLLVTLVLVDIFGACKILLLKIYSGHKDIETVNNTKDSRVEHEILF